MRALTLTMPMEQAGMVGAREPIRWLSLTRGLARELASARRTFVSAAGDILPTVF